MSLSRRRFIQASGLALCAGGLPLQARASGAQAVLPVPPLLESRRGQPLFLSLERTHWAFMGGRKVGTWGVNGVYLGPTVR
ncbi:MAG: twin-arginine translocation signal domain-containing protein, partial [Hafnia sp.]